MSLGPGPQHHPSVAPEATNPGELARRYPLASYFVVVFGVSLAALAVIGLPPLPGKRSHPPTIALIVFPFMVITVAAAGITLSAITGGRGAVTRLGRGIRRWRVPAGCWAALAIPPVCILAALGLLHTFASSAYTPQFFVIGLFFGVVAGFFEEIGWSGYAYPRMAERFGPRRGAIILGLLWGLWHFPVVDSLGAAAPHGRHWPLFFGAFVLAIAGLRQLIAWTYRRSGSLLMAQLMHASSTGFLVVLGAPNVTAVQEASWYALYGVLLWLVASALWLASSRRPGASGPSD